ncbi:MAG: hypothetical protein AAGE01_07505 [Pseudomonadota bacterium]
MDLVLAQAVVALEVLQFGPSEKNKDDSRSCRFEPRHLMSSPAILDHVGRRMADIATRSCRGSGLIGIATSGIAWTAVTSLHAGLPMLYVRKTAEKLVSNKLIEGRPPEGGKLILIDDLLFAGECKREAIRIIRDHGFEVTDLIVIVDRQLQRRSDGPRIEDEFGLTLHRLITMEEIVRHMIETGTITTEQLEDLIRDYRHFDRWELPAFAAG